ncbi:uncharacterized protein LOC125178717 [Hyalella azteca]|uniref:Uncharacterized protein LOC125178717 n=1 Tax=Hyalella azteca TaxID=294128 RepID=A0A979FRP1_HYAAZ|nr:uncharacterized protein LOC125178717 [Hyalella azteca]
MTNLAPENVTTRAAPGAITLFKFDPCATGVAALNIFVTNARTRNVNKQNAICTNENGRPLVIKTEEQRQKALQAVQKSWAAWAWLTATFTSDKVLQWPDGTNVTQCLTTKGIVVISPAEQYSMLDGLGNFVDSKSPSILEYPVLCYK